MAASVSVACRASRGRCVIAERNFGVGEVILREKPLVAWQVQEESVGSYRAFLEACVALSETALKLVVDMARPDFEEGEVANGELLGRWSIYPPRSVFACVGSSRDFFSTFRIY